MLCHILTAGTAGTAGTEVTTGNSIEHEYSSIRSQTSPATHTPTLFTLLLDIKHDDMLLNIDKQEGSGDDEMWGS